MGFNGKIQRSACRLKAELESIFCGLNMAHEKGWNNAHLESDCKNEVGLVTKEAEANHPCANIIEDCIGLIRITKAHVTHVLREGNRCADWLSKEGNRQDDIYVEIQEVQEQLLQMLEDTVGMAMERMY